MKYVQLFLYISSLLASTAVSQHSDNSNNNATKRHLNSCTYTPLSQAYLNRIKNGEASAFVPQAYYDGESTKFINAKGITEIHRDNICVNGADEYEGPVQLYDDGTHGDDVSGDGIYSRECVHFCNSKVDYSDVYGFAMADDFANGKIIVLDPAKKGTVPYEEIDIPQIPNAKFFASSHSFFFVDDEGAYYPSVPHSKSWLALNPNHVDHPTGKSVNLAALLRVFGDVFDFVTSMPLEGFFGGGIFKWQNYDRRGGAQPNADIGEIDLCSIGLTGTRVSRLAAAITMPHLERGGEWQNFLHELVHAVAGFEFHNQLEAARTGDGMHVPGACTIDHSTLQGPIWDWVDGAPNGIPRKDGKQGGLRLEANEDCASCPKSNLADCCSFRYLNRPFTAAEMKANPDLAVMSPTMQYIAGLRRFDDIPENKRDYYCMGSDTDGGCGTGSEQHPCTTQVNDDDWDRVTSDVVTKYNFRQLVAANGGKRFPERKFDVIRHAAIHVSARMPYESEITYHTLIWRQAEIQTEPWERIKQFGNNQWPYDSWTFQSGGKSVLHSRLHGIDCGSDASSIPSCQSERQTSDVCSDSPCAPGAICQNLDGVPLCTCREGLIGDGYECAFPSEAMNHYILPTAHELAQTPRYHKCFPDNNIWPNFIDETSIAPYPGGTAPYAPTSCYDHGVCKVGERCSRTEGCLPATRKSMCEDQGFNRGKCVAMGCCNWKQATSSCKARKGDTVAPCGSLFDVNKKNIVAKCWDENTCCPLSCAQLKDDNTQITQRGNCGKDCVAGILPDAFGTPHPELFLFPNGYYTNEEFYSYTNDKGPLYSSGTNKDLFNRCKTSCFDPATERKRDKFLWYITADDFPMKKDCRWLQKRSIAKQKKICLNANLSARGFSPPSKVCPVTCAPNV